MIMKLGVFGVFSIQGVLVDQYNVQSALKHETWSSVRRLIALLHAAYLIFEEQKFMFGQFLRKATKRSSVKCRGRYIVNVGYLS